MKFIAHIYLRFNQRLDEKSYVSAKLTQQNSYAQFFLLTAEQCRRLTRPRGYKTFFVHNSVEHEILNAHKYKNIKKFGLFKAQLSLECYFSRSYMLKCQQLLAFLTFMSGENFMLN